MDNKEYNGTLDYCANCDECIFLESYAEEYKWIDGWGYLCENCMNLEEYSHPEENDVLTIDEELEDLLV